MTTIPSPPPAYSTETFSASERSLLSNYFTNLDGPVFAITNLPEVVKGALFARYSRSSKSIRRLFLDEFVSGVDFTTGTRGGGATQRDQYVEVRRAEQLYRRVFNDYGDDSVAQLGVAHLACEQSSNILTKVLEWGRLAAYLEQSTRYIVYDQKLEGRWRYCIPLEVRSSTLIDSYCVTLDSLFVRYREVLTRVLQWLEATYRRSSADSEAVWRSTLRAKACDVARGLLPAATLSNVGICANGQAYEAMLLRMQSSPLQEARHYALMMLHELRKVIPSFLNRVDIPGKGLDTSRYLTEVRMQMESLVVAMRLSPSRGPTEPTVELVDWDRDGEAKIIASALYQYSHLSAVELKEVVARMTEQDKLRILRAYVGERANRRHRPGRAFEASYYHFDVVCDYAVFRDLQRHRMLTIEWQRLTPANGYTVPEEVTNIGAADIWDSAMDEATRLYYQMQEQLGSEVAQYALPFANRIRFYVRMNAREAMHLIELRTARGGHPQYRHLCQKMLALIEKQAGHRALASAMNFADLQEHYDLPRLESERRTEQKRNEKLD